MWKQQICFTLIDCSWIGGYGNEGFRILKSWKIAWFNDFRRLIKWKTLKDNGSFEGLQRLMFSDIDVF